MSRCTSKIIGSAITLVCLCLNAEAQKVDLFGGVGYASYSQPELHDYQDTFVQRSGLNATRVQEFPSYYTYMGGFDLVFKSFVAGLEAGHGSTGGRVYYEDYSGKLIGDMTVTYNYFAISPSLFLYRSEKFSLSGGTKLSMVLSELAVHNTKTVGSTSATEGEKFTGSNLGFQPNLVARQVFGPILIRASVGYELQNKSVPTTKDGDLFLDNGNGGQVHLKGNGYRLSIGVGSRLQKK